MAKRATPGGPVDGERPVFDLTDQVRLYPVDGSAVGWASRSTARASERPGKRRLGLFQRCQLGKQVAVGGVGEPWPDVPDVHCGVCIDTRTGLIAVDEIHNVSLATRTGPEASDMLKYFSERIPATFIYAGIDVERAGLLSGTRGEQIAGRFGMIRTTAFPRGEHWTGLIAALEHALRLHRHRADTLVGLADYLSAPPHHRHGVTKRRAARAERTNATRQQRTSDSYWGNHATQG